MAKVKIKFALISMLTLICLISGLFPNQFTVKAASPNHWEFWVGVRENKASSLTTELCSRWLITMKAN
jgi:hypothetical protein